MYYLSVVDRGLGPYKRVCFRYIDLKPSFVTFAISINRLGNNLYPLLRRSDSPLLGAMGTPIPINIYSFFQKPSSLKITVVLIPLITAGSWY